MERSAAIRAILLPAALLALARSGDGVRDLVVADAESSRVALLAGLGDGTFAEDRTLPSVEAARRVDAYDLNGDGRDDVLILGPAAVTLHLSRTDEHRPRILALEHGLSDATDFRLAEVDGDGHLDIVVADAGQRAALFFAGLPDGEFDATVQLVALCHGDVRDGPLAIVGGDLDADGTGDVLVADLENDLLHGFASVGCATRAQLRRGDADGDRVVNLTDAVFLLNALFLSGAPPACPDAADTDDDGVVNLTDVLRLLNYQFLAGPPPAPPGADGCGPDGTEDALGACATRCR